MLQLMLLFVLLGSVTSFSVPRSTFDQDEKPSGDAIDDDDVSISTLLEMANKHLGESPADPVVTELDIAVGYGLQNADPCTAGDCMWPKSKGGIVYVPYRISDQYSEEEKSIIRKGLRFFSRYRLFRQTTCIDFIPRTTEQDFVDIKPLKGCYSYVGRQGGPQTVSLNRTRCLRERTIQHEMMHALGFKHEQCRSDRDLHVKIHLENVEPGKEGNFKKVQTNNLDTPYDYNSIMHYGRKAFSVNGEPTIVPIPDPTVPIGKATKMSKNDVLRINRLYACWE